MPITSPSSRPLGLSRWSLIALVLLGCAGAFALAQRRSLHAKPRLVGTTNVQPLSIRRAEGAWYWREHTKNAGDRLMRISASGSQVVAKADTLSCYTLAEGKLGWVERTGDDWTIFLAEADGSKPIPLLKRGAEPMGIAIAQGTLYWLQRLPAPARDSGHFPSLLPSLEVVSMPLTGGKPNSLARLWESEDGEVLGLHANTLFVAAYRHPSPGSFCLYRVPLGKDSPVRIVGERDLAHPLLTQTGVLYWTVPSKEVAGPPSAVCVRRLDANGQIETLSDWLPFSGELYETTHGVLYRDRETDSALWAAGRNDIFPVPLPIPVGYAAVAAGEGLMLLAPLGVDTAHLTLYETPLP